MQVCTHTQKYIHVLGPTPTHSEKASETPMGIVSPVSGCRDGGQGMLLEGGDAALKSKGEMAWRVA